MESTSKSAQIGGGRITWQCACFNSRKAARAVTRFYDHMLAPSGLKATQLTMLGAISISGTARMSELASLLALDKTTLTRNLRRLQADGLIAIATGTNKHANAHKNKALTIALPIKIATGCKGKRRSPSKASFSVSSRIDSDKLITLDNKRDSHKNPGAVLVSNL